MMLLVRFDRLVHRLMRGRCWNRRACLWLSQYAATRSEKDH
jgi:hypothetical protein